MRQRCDMPGPWTAIVSIVLLAVGTGAAASSSPAGPELSAAPPTPAFTARPAPGLASLVVTGDWTWQGGSKTVGAEAVYGKKGVAGAAPGSRSGAARWLDAAGRMVLFGGDADEVGAGSSYLNDLWRWDGSRWTWLGGSSGTNQAGVYGSKGAASPSNVPGARSYAASWSDASGNLWLFGGVGLDGSGATGHLDDLWRWDGTNWTWMGGTKSVDLYGVYGTKGVASASNLPGGRFGSAAWSDATGNVWLLGGQGYPESGLPGSLNDLWKWNGSAWAWMGGATVANDGGSYGTKGLTSPTNLPCARLGAASWVDDRGVAWVFGGTREEGIGRVELNDLWKWDGTSWTWTSGSSEPDQPGVHGTKGLAATANVPGARHGSAAWTGSAGKIWLFGGFGYDAGAVRGFLGDVWQWDGSNWTWVSGAAGIDVPGFYGTLGIPSPSNQPGGRLSAASWVDPAGDLWAFGGVGLAASATPGALCDLWRWNGSSWVWVSGADVVNRSGAFGVKGVPGGGIGPGGRHLPTAQPGLTARTALVFGGTQPRDGVTDPHLNDLWQWDGANWTWLSGSSLANQPGVYGTQLVPSPSNVPGARRGSVSWIDALGRFLLFGGAGVDANGSLRSLNDVWRWDGTAWTWLKGSSTGAPPGVYGTKGTANGTNTPGGRSRAASWTDAAGNVWVFGGYGYPESGGIAYLNDLWKWDGSNWTWMSGSKTGAAPGVYGVLGVAADANVPGARYGAAAWTDGSGNLWLFGGNGYTATSSGRLNDLWRWDGARWTWMAGSSAPNRVGTYGLMGVPSTTSTPGGRMLASAWKDAGGAFWLFGGDGFPAAGTSGYLSDLWRWDGAGGTWTWVAGSDETGLTGTYGTLGVPNAANAPGSRASGAAWVDGSGDLAQFGGQGNGDVAGVGELDDVWTWGLSCRSLAAISAASSACASSAGNGAFVPDAGAGATYSWSATGGTITSGAGTRQVTYTAGASGSVVLSVTVTVPACSGSDSRVVAIDSLPLAPSPTNDGPACERGTVQLSVGAVAGATYSWTGPNGFASSLMNPTLAAVTPAMAGAYFVTVSVNGCTSPAGSTNVVVWAAPPKPVVMAPAAVAPLQVFTASVPGVIGRTYSWAVTKGEVIGGAGTSQITIRADATGPVRISIVEHSLVTGCASAEGTALVDVAVPATRFYPVTPCRVFDTRESGGASAAAPALAAGETRTLTVGSRCGLDSASIRSLSVNQTVTQQPASGDLVICRGDLGSASSTSTISFRAATTRANGALVELSRAGDGTIKVQNRSGGAVHFVLDVNGYFK